MLSRCCTKVFAAIKESNQKEVKAVYCFNGVLWLVLSSVGSVAIRLLDMFWVDILRGWNIAHITTFWLCSFFGRTMANHVIGEANSKESYLESTWPSKLKVNSFPTFSRAARNPRISSMSDCLLESLELSRMPMVSAVLIRLPTRCEFRAVWKRSIDKLSKYPPTPLLCTRCFVTAPHLHWIEKSRWLIRKSVPGNSERFLSEGQVCAVVGGLKLPMRWCRHCSFVFVFLPREPKKSRVQGVCAFLAKWGQDLGALLPYDLSLLDTKWFKSQSNRNPIQSLCWKTEGSLYAGKNPVVFFQAQNFNCVESASATNWDFMTS